MSTPTAIEIVRESLAKLQDPFVAFHARPEKKAFTTALASVLRDAERFAALERAHDGCDSTDAWSYVNDDGKRRFYAVPLAELADRLKGTP